MRRREFITLLGGAAAAWPVAARAQKPTLPVIGYLDPGPPEAGANFVTAFRKGLSEAGYVEGRDVAIEYRWGQNDNDRLPELVTDLVRRRVSLIATAESTDTTNLVKAATATIPIVFVAGADPVQSGLVESLNRPGGNATGLIHMNVALGAKRLGLLHELVPDATPVAVLVPNYSQPFWTTYVTEVQTAASALNVRIEILPAGTAHEIDAAFASLLQKQAKALLVFPWSLFTSRRSQIVTLAARHVLPAIYPWREDALAGGLVSYGPSITDQFRQAGIYAGRILKGERPADLPVMRATKFEFIINLQTARTLGVEVPPTLLALADEVIE
jgi:putative ABC transport system substrate-binding protein